jgi:hypothetical protein
MVVTYAQQPLELAGRCRSLLLPGAPIEAMRVSRRQLNGTPVVKARKKQSGVCWVMIHMPRVR